jgi:hypothetical protein
VSTSLGVLLLLSLMSQGHLYFITLSATVPRETSGKLISVHQCPQPCWTPSVTFELSFLEENIEPI